MADNTVPRPALPKQSSASSRSSSGITAPKSAYEYPLIIKHLWHAPLLQTADEEIVYRDLRRFTYREFRERVGRLASALAGMGVQPGDTVGVLDWDSNRFLEAFFAVPMMGAVLQTVTKLQAYELQDAGIDTIEANHALGFKADFRDFSLAAAILHDLRIPRVRLLTNNPRKVRALSAGGIEVVERLPCEVGPTAHSLAYLQTKKQKMGHALSLGISASGWGCGFAPAGEVAGPPSR